MGCNYRPLGLAMGALLLASCAGKDVETATPQEEPLAKQDSASDIVTTGSRIKVGNLEAESQFRLGVVAPAPPPPAVAMRSPEIWSPPYHDVGRDKFTDFAENAFKIVREAPVSTFSIDVDTASYSWVRASLNQNVLPQPAAVRCDTGKEKGRTDDGRGNQQGSQPRNRDRNEQSWKQAGNAVAP